MLSSHECRYYARGARSVIGCMPANCQKLFFIDPLSGMYPANNGNIQYRGTGIKRDIILS
jgi:hypothetical protein